MPQLRASRSPMPRSNSDPSYDTDPRLPQAVMIISALAAVLVAGIVLVVRGLL